jgi:tetratricopeptide (TPR) repeat protein
MAGKIKGQLIYTVMLMLVATIVSADDSFDKLIAAGDYRGAVDYAEEKIAMSDRDAKTWVKIANANVQLGMNEKALACYLVSWRLNPNDYESMLGCAKVYNNMNQPNEAMNMAQKALDVNFAAEASWEYAKACIALNRSADAKKALEKVIQSDAQNAIANKELGTIYYNEKAYVQAIPLLKKTYKSDSDRFSAYKIGKAYIEAGIADSAIIFLKESISKGGQTESHIELARAYFKLKNFKDASTEFSTIPKDTLTATDLYSFAFSKESAGSAITETVELYELAIVKFENSVAPEALLAREKSARYRLQTKKYESALKNILFISENDQKGAVVPDAFFLLADAYLATGDMQKAISNLEKSVAINSKNVEAYARLADAYQKNNMPDKAKQTLESMLSLSPNDPGVYLSLGQYNLKAKKYSEAHGMFEKSNSLKNSAEAFEGLAITEFNLNQSALARSSATRAVQMDATLVESRIILCKVLIAESNYKDAQGHLEIVVQKKNDIEYLKMLADCYLQNGSKEKLLGIDKKLVALSSTDVESRMRLAKYAEETKNLQDALSLYKELLSIKPEDPETVYKLYELSNATGDPVWATIYLKKYLLFSPGNAIAHGLLGDLYYADKKNDDALNEYRTALKINPAAKGFLKQYTEIVIAKGLQDEVIDALDGLIKSGDADGGTYTTLGLIYEKKKMSTKAIEMYQSALQREPSNVDALAAMAGCQASIGDVNGAIISYEQILMMNPKAVNEYKKLGDLYLRSFKQVEAIKAFKLYLAKDSTDLEVVKMVGNDAYRNKEYKDAQRYLGILASGASDEDLYDFADACQMNGDTTKAIVALELLKSRKLKMLLQVKMCVALAAAYEKAGRDADAIKVLNELILLSGGKEPETLYKRAFLAEKTNRVGAIKYYEENCKTFPADYRNFLRLGVMLSESKETLPKAVELLKRVTELAASVPVVWLELGKVYVRLNRDREALDAFKKYAENDPQNLEANRNLGILLVKAGNVNEGLVYLEIANTFQPGDPVVMACLAKGYLHTGRNTEAMDLLLKVKEVAKDDPEIRFELYQLLIKGDQKEKALAEIKSLVELTNDPKYILIYAKNLLDGGKLKEALDAVEDILAANAENLDALMLKALALRTDKKYEEAIEVYKEVVYVKSDYASAFFERAETHLIQNKFQWAETFYKRTLEVDPKFALAEFGLAKIAKVRKDTVAYKLHLENAYKLDPDNAQIKEELSRVN